MNDSSPRWVADPSIRWRILLSADLDQPPTAAALQAELDELGRRQGWPVGTVLRGDDPAALRAELAEVTDAPVAVGVSGRLVVISCHHAYVDGLGLLAVLGALTGTTVTSDARGVDNRPGAGSFVTALVRRLVEVVAAPPARVAGGRRSDQAGDVMVQLVLPIALGPADLVWAAATGIAEHNRAAGLTSRHTTIAVGAGRRGPEAESGTIADRSALIRLRDLEGLDRDEVRDLLRAAPLVPKDGQGPGGGRAVLAVMRLLSRRLGSTLLVSHLGEVRGEGLTDLAFYPVTAGGTGLSLGAVGSPGATSLTLRGRAADWSAESLTALLYSIARASAR
jgi:hypothetical protein